MERSSIKHWALMTPILSPQARMTSTARTPYSTPLLASLPALYELWPTVTCIGYPGTTYSISWNFTLSLRKPSVNTCRSLSTSEMSVIYPVQQLLHFCYSSRLFSANIISNIDMLHLKLDPRSLKRRDESKLIHSTWSNE